MCRWRISPPCTRPFSSSDGRTGPWPDAQTKKGSNMTSSNDSSQNANIITSSRTSRRQFLQAAGASVALLGSSQIAKPQQVEQATPTSSPQRADGTFAWQFPSADKHKTWEEYSFSIERWWGDFPKNLPDAMDILQTTNGQLAPSPNSPPILFFPQLREPGIKGTSPAGSTTGRL